MCSERSGSNFILKLLNAHSKICGPSTKHIINPVARNIFRYEPLTNSDNWHELINDIFNLLSSNFSEWKKEFNFQDIMKMAPVGDIGTLIKNIFMEEAIANGKNDVFIKENHLYEFLPFLLINFPKSKYIYQVRDPRDVALSWKKNPSHRGGIVKAAKQWKIDQQNFLKNYNELKKINKATIVKYEDLIENPKRELEKILRFLGHKYESSILNFNSDELTIKNANKQPAWNNLSKSILSDNKKKYIEELTDYEIKIIENICFYEMRYLGYKNSFSKKEINEISEQSIANYNEKEIKQLNYDPIEDILKNMEKKKVFYCKEIKKA